VQKEAPGTPTSRRERLARTLHDRGLAGAFLRARSAPWWPWSWLTVVVYHRVADVATVGDLDPELVDATPAEFERQMRFLRENFTPVDVDQVEAALTDGAHLPPNPVLVTFDDGYRDNLQIAAPVLRRHGIRATLFVATDYASTGRLFWWERIHAIIKRSTRPTVVLDYPAPLTLDLGDARRRATAVRQATRVVKDVFNLDLDRFLGELAHAAGVCWTDAEDRACAEGVVMCWDDVMEARRAGMDIQSHTVSHRVLHTLPDNRLDAELGDARAELESRLGRPVTCIAYPVGRPIVEHARVRAALDRAGYTIGFTTTPGVNRLSPRSDRFDLYRIPVDRGTPDDLFQGCLAVPWLAR
jgi:peptidoglycan/xylan/chitin deacetylase (PgdA/CDA1 family)